MSWDVYLKDDRGHYEGEWNCTHNVNRHIEAALTDIGYVLPLYEGNNILHAAVAGDPRRVAWFDVLDGMDGPSGQKYLKDILDQLKKFPVEYKKLDPENGWGDYDGLCKVLEEMINRVPEYPCVWEASG